MMTTIWRNPRFVQKCFNCGMGLELECYYEMGFISNRSELYDKPFCSRTCVKLKHKEIIADSKVNLINFYSDAIIIDAIIIIIASIILYLFT